MKKKKDKDKRRCLCVSSTVFVIGRGGRKMMTVWVHFKIRFHREDEVRGRGKVWFLVWFEFGNEGKEEEEEEGVGEGERGFGLRFGFGKKN